VESFTLPLSGGAEFIIRRRGQFQVGEPLSTEPMAEEVQYVGSFASDLLLEFVRFLRHCSDLDRRVLARGVFGAGISEQLRQAYVDGRLDFQAVLVGLVERLPFGPHVQAEAGYVGQDAQRWLECLGQGRVSRAPGNAADGTAAIEHTEFFVTVT